MQKKRGRKPKVQPIIPPTPLPVAPVMDPVEFLKIFVKDLHQSTLTAISKYIAYYQVEEGIAPHTLHKVDLILGAKDQTEATLLAKKAQESGFMYCMAKWSEGLAKGPRTKEYVRKQARKEEEYADRLEIRGADAASVKHREISKKLWEEYKTME